MTLLFDPADVALTPRQLVVLQLLGRGYGTGQIALLLESTFGEVERQAGKAAATLGTCSSEEAVTLARRVGLIL